MRLVRLLIRSRPTDVGVFSKALGASVGAGVARATYRLLDQQGRASSSQLLRTNHRGESVTLAQGPATVLGATAGVALTPSLSRSARAAGVITALACGGLGLYDDLTGTGSAKGLRGHFAALREGEVTSGAIKVAGIGGTALVTGPLARGGRGGIVDGVLSALLIAASANALNLFDLRPGRAVKVFAGAVAPTMLGGGDAGQLLAGPLGAAVGLLPDDLGEQSMLGDTGANTLGALLGTAGAATLSRRGLVTAVIAATAVTVLSERVSFSSVIDANSLLRRVDQWGRRSE